MQYKMILNTDFISCIYNFNIPEVHLFYMFKVTNIMTQISSETPSKWYVVSCEALTVHNKSQDTDSCRNKSWHIPQYYLTTVFT
jgi:hypothetical protein